MDDPNFRLMLANLGDARPVTIDGVEYTGAQLAMLVALNPAIPEDEANRTPQLISELGRVCAAAFRAKELADAEYRAWRDGQVFALTNSVDKAKAVGFACGEGLDAKGKPKPEKPPSREAAEGYLRTTPEYLDHYRRKMAAEEAWSTIYAALEAAKARTWAARAFARNGADETYRSGSGSRDMATGTHQYDTPRGSLEEAEEAASTGARSPLPPRPAKTGPPSHRS